MQLTQELAQEIVEKTKEIIKFNINIFDDTGYIIASGQKERLNTFHEGAYEVIGSGISDEFSIEKAKKYKGVQPGILYPIQFNDKIIGVVGMSGDPEEVRNYGALVKMTTEMMLRQDFLTNQLRAEKGAQNNFIKNLALGQFGEDLELFIERGKNLGIDVLLSRQVIIIELLKMPEFKENLSDLLQKQIYRDEVLKILEKHYDHDEDLILSMGNVRFLILKRINNQVKNTSSIKTDLGILIDSLRKKGFDARVGIGSSQIHWLNLKISYQEASDALFLGERMESTSNILHIEDLLLERTLNSIDDLMKKNIINSFLGATQNLDSKYWNEMEKTLGALFDSNLNVSEAAKKLFLHRNSLTYRLNKITEQTGLDPLSFYDAVKLYVCLKINKLEER
ncbi:MAG: hypothetical protein APF76_15940 [Desulfitibacter sp. BRH_c19]|nr:MAG: hypothetical protein APF76_15940 [Desulfitibacter sp. BRH_c19]